jgi:hypothetical protein
MSDEFQNIESQSFLRNYQNEENKEVGGKSDEDFEFADNSNNKNNENNESRDEETMDFGGEASDTEYDFIGE